MCAICCAAALAHAGVERREPYPVLRVDDYNELFSGRVPKDGKPLQEDIARAELIVSVFPQAGGLVKRRGFL